MAVSASIDPEGVAGGPVVETFGNRIAEYGKLTWETMPERLQAAGVSWKVYSDRLCELALSPLPYFKAYNNPFSITGIELVGRGLTPDFPDDFAQDVQGNKLPAVSWILPPLAECEHPAAPPGYGEYLIHSVLTTLVSNPAVWAQTVLFVVHDENGGFFDHVPPLTPPPGTEGEWLTAKTLPAAAQGITGPVGLGFRTGCLVISPFSRGGYVCSQSRSTTPRCSASSRRGGASRCPNLSPWRRANTGDLTAALALSRLPDTSLPGLPATSLGELSTAEQAVLDSLAGTLHFGIDYPLPTSNSMPSQETGPPRPPVP